MPQSELCVATYTFIDPYIHEPIIQSIRPLQNNCAEHCLPVLQVKIYRHWSLK